MDDDEYDHLTGKTLAFDRFHHFPIPWFVVREKGGCFSSEILLEFVGLGLENTLDD